MSQQHNAIGPMNRQAVLNREDSLTFQYVVILYQQSSKVEG